MAWSRVQGNSVQAASPATSGSLTLTSKVSNGSVVCGSVLVADGIGVSKVTDDKGNVYDISTGTFETSVSPLNAVGFFSVAPISNVPQTITVTLTASSGTIWIVADEFTPPFGTTACSFDGTGQLTNSALVSSPGTFANLQSNVLIYEANFSSATTAAASPYTSATNNINQIASGFLNQANPSTTNNSNFTGSGSNWIVNFGVAPIARPSWQVIQHLEFHNQVAGSSNSVSLPNPVTPGNVILICLAPGTATDLTTLSSITDNLGNNYIPNIIPNLVLPNTPVRFMTWSGGQTTNAPQTFTASFTVSQVSILWQVIEVAPPPNTISVTLDASFGSSGTPGAVVTTGSNEFFFNITEPFNNGTSFPVPQSPCNIIEGYLSTWTSIWLIVPNPASTTITWGGAGGTALFTYSALALKSQQSATTGGRYITEEEVVRATEKAISSFSRHGAQARWGKYVPGRMTF